MNVLNSCTFLILFFVTNCSGQRENVLPYSADATSFLSNDSHISVGPVSEGEFVFVSKGKEVLKIGADGTFWIKGRKVTKDLEIYEGMKRLMSGRCK